jgi:ubiquinone biosynthesis protein COQ9
MNDALLDEVLRHVPFDGWSMRALESAAGGDALTLDREFPNGVADAVRAFSDRADAAMVAALAYDPPDRVRDRIAAAVRARLEHLAPHREAVRRLTAWFALPGHQAVAARCLYRTVDEIWYAAGDRSTNFSFYTKRALLAAVYGATVLYWLEDRSEGFADTWTFLARRIDGITRLAARRPFSTGRFGTRPAFSRPPHRPMRAATPRRSPR